MRLNSPKYNGPNFFGFGEHGNFESKDKITYLDVPDDQGPCYYFFNNFILNEGHTLTTTKPCRGLYIYVHNAAIINGIISMTDRGIYSPPEGEYENGYTPLGMNHVFISDGSLKTYEVPGNDLAAGGYTTVPSGAQGGSYADLGWSYTVGATGINGRCGGGGCGDAFGHFSVACAGGKGGCAGVFSGGAGGSGTVQIGHGGYATRSASCGVAGQDYGGGGGHYFFGGSYNSQHIPGRGNPTYIISSTDPVEYIEDTRCTGTGGVLYCIFNKMYMGNSTTLTSEGGSTNSYSFSYSGYICYRKPAGGSGGGAITLLYNSNMLSTNLSKCYSVIGGYHAGNGSFRSQQIL